jgi:hypothetical protein
MRKRILVLLLLGSTVMVHGDALPIHLAWENLIQRGGPNRTNVAESVALHRNRAVVGAILGRAETFSTDVVIRGFNATTGNLVWSDEFPGSRVFVEAAQDYAIAVGGIFPFVNGNNLLIRGYDLHGGAIRWTTYAALSGPQKILVRNGKLVIVGWDPDFAPLHGIVLVFDSATGMPLWNTSIDIAGSETALWDVDDAGRNIVVVGTKDVPARDLIVRSYRLRDGRLRWELIEPQVSGFTVRVQNDLAYVAGFEQTPAGIQTFLAAYRVSDGHLEWKAAALSAGGALTRLGVTPTAVIAAGFGRIEAHDALTGNLLWSKATPQENLSRLIPIGDQVATIGVKEINPPGFDAQLVIRLLDATGQIVAEDLREIGPGNSYVDAALLNDRLAVVGLIGGIAGGALVRVYDMRPFE